MKLNAEKLEGIINELWDDVKHGPWLSTKVTIGGGKRMQVHLMVTRDRDELDDDPGEKYACLGR